MSAHGKPDDLSDRVLTAIRLPELDPADMLVWEASRTNLRLFESMHLYDYSFLGRWRTKLFHGSLFLLHHEQQYVQE